MSSFDALKTRFNTCSMRELCVPIGLEQAALQQLDELVTKRTQENASRTSITFTVFVTDRRNC